MEASFGQDQPKTIQWVSNAPEHWPIIETERLPFPRPETVADDAANKMLFLSRLHELLENSQVGCKLASVSNTYLTSAGILEVPFEVQDGEDIVAVFLYPESNPEYASHFWGVDQILRSLGKPAPVYFAPSALPVVPPKNYLLPFDPGMLEKVDKVPPGKYAMWWATSEDPNFWASETFFTASEIFKNLDGIYSYVLAFLFTPLGLVDKGVRRMALPDNVTVPLRGPEHRYLLLEASREKGIGFLFNTMDGSFQYRDDFLKVFLSFVMAVREKIEARGLPMDPPDQTFEGGPAGWWAMIEAFPKRKEGSSNVKMFRVADVE